MTRSKRNRKTYGSKSITQRTSNETNEQTRDTGDDVRVGDLTVRQVHVSLDGNVEERWHGILWDVNVESVRLSSMLSDERCSPRRERRGGMKAKRRS